MPRPPSTDTPLCAHTGGPARAHAPAHHRSLMRVLCICAFALLLQACGGGGSSSRAPAPPAAPPVAPPATPVPTPQVVNTFAFDAASPYASVLRNCTYAGDATQNCTLGTLPFIGQQTSNPTIDQIMQRVLVSHSWMGSNFRAVLQQLHPDVLLMMRSLTAVVIASDVRPAFYDPNTAAIYLDADFLWLTQAQAADVTDEPDFRSGFGSELQVRLPWRYVRNNQRLSIVLNPDGSRDLNQLLVIMGFLMYHELAHAVDFMAPTKMATVSANQTTVDAITSGAILSDAFTSAQPLTSATLRNLAQVSFRGVDATDPQKAITPAELAQPFALDGATQYYAYSTQFEDFASILETVLMSFHFGYEKDTGITDNPASGSSNDGIVAWGQRGRLGDQAVLTRALTVLQALYPGDLAAVEAHINSLPLPTQLPVGATWGASETLSPVTTLSTDGIDKIRRDFILERRAIH